MDLQFCEYLSNSGIKFVASPLQPWYFDNKITSEKIVTLMKGGFLLIDSKLEGYQEW